MQQINIMWLMTENTPLQNWTVRLRIQLLWQTSKNIETWWLVVPKFLYVKVT